MAMITLGFLDTVSIKERRYIKSPVELCSSIILLCPTRYVEPLKLSNQNLTVRCHIIKSRRQF
jgi:hypothetical protein